MGHWQRSQRRLREGLGMRKTSLRAIPVLTLYEWVKVRTVFSPTKNLGCSPMKWLQTPLLHLCCCPPPPTSLNINLKVITYRINNNTDAQ